jgi:putative ABC transport system permease protein
MRTNLKLAVRRLLSDRIFTATALTCMVLGIAANVLIFSLVNGVVLRPLPYPASSRLAMVRFTPPNASDQKLGTNPGGYFFIRDHNQVFERMGAIRIVGFSAAPDSSADAAEREWVEGAWVSPGLADTLHVQPILGQWFSDTDTAVNVVISSRLWNRMFGGSRDVIGKKLRLDLGIATIVGVMPPEFQTLTSSIDFWRLQPDESLASALRSPNRVFHVFARMKPGVTLEHAQFDMNRLSGPLAQEYEMNRGWGIQVESLHDVYFGRFREPLFLFQAAVLLLLIIACANVAGLLLAQANGRQKELAVRAALGGTRRTLIAQLLTESVLLAGIGGVVGVTLAWAGLNTFRTFTLSNLSPGTQVAIDPLVMAFAASLSLATGLVFGAIPAIQLSRGNVSSVLRESPRGSTAGSSRQAARRFFVMTQVSLALVLLVGAGTVTRSLLRLNQAELGLNADRVLTFQVPFPRTLYQSAPNSAAGGRQVRMSEQLNVLVEQVRERIGALPGVSAVAASMTPPLGGTARRFVFTRDGEVLSPSEEEAHSGEWYPVTPSYFKALNIPILRGRDFSSSDVDQGAPVAALSKAAADRLFPNSDPIGKRIHVSMVNDSPREIVAVVGNVRQNRFQDAPEMQVYVPRNQLPPVMDMTLSFDVLVGTFIVKTSGEPAAAAGAARRIVSTVDKSLAVSNVWTVQDYADRQFTEFRRYTILLSVFGVVSIALAFIGVFGIMAHSVNQRTNEIGVRMALGATPRSILGMILREGTMMVAVGMAVGVVISLVASRLLSRLLTGGTTIDILTLLLMLLGVAVISVVACYVPTRRALRVSPITALRAE